MPTSTPVLQGLNTAIKFLFSNKHSNDCLKLKNITFINRNLSGFFFFFYKSTFRDKKGTFIIAEAKIPTHVYVCERHAAKILFQIVKI